MKTNKINARKLEFSIDLLNSSGLIICVPDSNLEQKYAKQIQKEINNFTHSEIVSGILDSKIRSVNQPIILIGNLANNEVVKDLYYRFLLTTDFWYPGPSGYEVRMLLDPYGSGQNIIHIGYSDDVGLKKAVEAFIPRINKVIKHISEIHPTRLHITKSEEMQIRTIKAPLLIWMNIARDIYKKGYLGYLTGDITLIKAYLDMWRAIVGYPIVKDDQKIKDLHLKMSNLIQSFRLIETAGLIKDKKLHSDITNYIINWPSTDQGLIRIDKGDYMHPEFPRQNHGMIPSLGLAFLIDYCKTYSFNIENIDKWEQLVEKAYHPYMDGSWKPVCDGTCHGWWLSQPALLEHGLIDPKHRYFTKGGAKKAANAAMSLVNNSGLMPSSGDFSLLRAFPGTSLRHAMNYYSDGRYKFVHDMGPSYLSSKYHVYMPRMFDTGLKPVVPKDQIGIKITPMDRLIYNSWEKAPKLVKEMLHTGPDTTIDKTFDKLTIRTGWQRKDQYLLIDGLGNNSNHTHSYPDAMGIIEYYHLGESWIVAENGLKFPEDANNNILTIVRKGEEFKIPSFAELIETNNTDDTYYIAMRLNNYSKTNWTREINLYKDVGIVIIDTVDILNDGDYAISTHIRTPGIVNINKNTMTSTRKADVIEEKTFSVEVHCSEEFKAGIRENDFALSCRNHKGEAQPRVPEEDNVAEWFNRYHTTNRVVSSLDSRVDKVYKKGDKIQFLHFAYAVNKDNEIKPELYIENEQIKVRYNTKSWVIKSIKNKIYKLNGNVEPINKHIKEIRNLDFKFKLKKVLSGEIHSFDSIGDSKSIKYYVGHDDNLISCLDFDLNIIWSNEIVREPTYCYWWELDYPSAVEIKAFSYKELDYIIVGCGDLFVRCFSSNGIEKWRFQYINGVPGRINIFDSDADGVPEILVGGEIISNRSQCRVLGLDGKLKYELDAEFWTSRMTAYAQAGNEFERYVALGANRGRNLHLYRTFFKGDKTPVKMFEKKLGGEIYEIEINLKNHNISASSSEGFTVTFDMNGQRLDL